MRYIPIIIVVLSLGACQNPTVETLEAEKAGLVKLWEEEVKKSKAEASRARGAEAMAIIAQEEAERAMEMARLAQAEAEKQKAALEKCKSGK